MLWLALSPLAHLQLRLRRVLAQRPHDRAQLLGRDGAVAVLVKEGKGLLLFFGEGRERAAPRTVRELVFFCACVVRGAPVFPILAHDADACAMASGRGERGERRARARVLSTSASARTQGMGRTVAARRRGHSLTLSSQPRQGGRTLNSATCSSVRLAAMVVVWCRVECGRCCFCSEENSKTVCSGRGAVSRLLTPATQAPARFLLLSVALSFFSPTARAMVCPACFAAAVTSVVRDKTTFSSPWGGREGRKEGRGGVFARLEAATIGASPRARRYYLAPSQPSFPSRPLRLPFSHASSALPQPSHPHPPAPLLHTQAPTIAAALTASLGAKKAFDASRARAKARAGVGVVADRAAATAAPMASARPPPPEGLDALP
jgi:hypothetical protein